MRVRYDFVVAGYVVLPEHVHLLVSEPKQAVLDKALQALKLSVAVQRRERPFWQARYYDFNVYTPDKRSEKIQYMHNNPVRRGLAAEPGQWPWSSYGHYATGECFTVEIESEWTAARRNRATTQTHISEARCGALLFFRPMNQRQVYGQNRRHLWTQQQSSASLPDCWRSSLLCQSS
jgi:putative transposase